MVDSPARQNPIQRTTTSQRLRRLGGGGARASSRPIPGRSQSAVQLAADLAALVESGLVVPVERDGVVRYAVSGEADGEAE